MVNTQEADDGQLEHVVEIGPHDEALDYVERDGKRYVRIKKMVKKTRKPRPKARSPIRSGQWDASMNDVCMDCIPLGCMACCFPCATAAQVADRIGASFGAWYVGVAVLIVGFEASFALTCVMGFESSDEYANDNQEEDALSKILGYVSLGFAVAIVAALWRRRKLVRTKFNLPGSFMDDCWRSALCPCCSLAQNAIHVRSYTPGACSFGRPDELPGYSNS